MALDGYATHYLYFNFPPFSKVEEEISYQAHSAQSLDCLIIVR